MTATNLTTRTGRTSTDKAGTAFALTIKEFDTDQTYPVGAGHWTVFSCPNASATFGPLGVSFQVIDAYAFQRELSIIKQRPGAPISTTPGVMNGYDVHVYQHPGRREQQVVSKGVAKRMISRFRELLDQHPSLLWNPPMWGVGYAMHNGFVVAHERMFRGDLSVKALP